MLPRRFLIVPKLFQLSLKYVYIFLMNYIIFNSNIVIIYVKYLYLQTDYCNSLLAGLTVQDFTRLQRLQNAAARYIHIKR